MQGIEADMVPGFARGAATKAPSPTPLIQVLRVIELIRTNDIVLIGFAQSLLEGAAIPVLVADGHMSLMEGSIGAFPRRLLVPADWAEEARRLLMDADLGHELRDA